MKDHKQIVGGSLGSKKNKSLKAQVNVHEQELAAKLGGYRQPLSGALEGHKGDIKLDHFLLDSKETSGELLSIGKKDILKITKEAMGERKEPALVLTWNSIKEAPNEWICIPLEVFKKMLDNNQDASL
jgi:hypothetical protein